MALSNAERQARYREKRKQLAARGVMSEAHRESLLDLRRHLREWRRSLAAFAEGRMRMTTNNVDTTAEHVVRVRRMIAHNEAVLLRFDPHGLTADGNIEIGEVSAHESAGVFPGRWVAYSLDEQGRAVKLRVYTAEGAARADARLGAGRYAGRVHDDMWAISPPGGAPSPS
jgi:hypothetical protein